MKIPVLLSLLLLSSCMSDHLCTPGEIGYDRRGGTAICKQKCDSYGTCREFWVRFYPTTPEDVK